MEQDVATVAASINQGDLDRDVTEALPSGVITARELLALLARVPE